MCRSMIAVLQASLAILLVETCLSNSAAAWGLKTHVWIGQQTLNDALDGDVEIGGSKYLLPDDVKAALTAHPDRYLMGHLGPDVFPDPLVGQTTTHPGVDRGWQTDDWIEHLVRSAANSEEIAFSYGFVGHAAGDIFAHTYVNMYAGDVFDLSDTEREVELRHFVLEKYIETLTPHPTTKEGRPIAWGDPDLRTATSYLRDALIYKEAVSSQYLAAGTGAHLASMHSVHASLMELDRATQELVAKVAKAGSGWLKEYQDLQIELATGEAQLFLAETSLDAAEASLRLKRDAVDRALAALDGVNDIIQRNPELITRQQQLGIAAAQRAIEAGAEAAKLAREIAELANRAAEIQNRLGKLVCKIVPRIKLPDLRIPKIRIRYTPAPTAKMLWPVDHDLRHSCEQANEALSKIQEAVTGRKTAYAAAIELERTSREAEATAQREGDRLKRQLEEATRGISEGTYQAAIDISEAELRLGEDAVREGQQAVAELRKGIEKIRAEMHRVNDLVDVGRDFFERYNGLSLLVGNWLRGSNIAAEEYIKASHRAGLKMLTNNGSPLKEYQDWLGCYGAVFMAVPFQAGRASCEVKSLYEDVMGGYNDLIDSLPEPLRWLLNPTREARRLLLDRVRPELERAARDLVAFVTDPTTAEFLDLLSNPTNVTRDRLNEVYARDGSGKNLIEFDAIADDIDRDLALTNGQFNPEVFAPAKHSVTLAKLSLLGPDELNRLVRDLAGEQATIYGPALYEPAKRFSLLFDAVRSIDGNHQWQAYGLPHPRRIGTPLGSPADHHFGYSFHEDRTKGFRLWADPTVRQRVFLALFPESVLGSLGERPELRHPNYSHPACPDHPYPETQWDRTGAVRESDATCRNVERVTLLLAPSPDQNAYRTRYFQCGLTSGRGSYWTIVGSHIDVNDAVKQAALIQEEHPGIYAEVYPPLPPNNHYAVMLAACTSKERAREAQRIAVERGIAAEAFVWTR